MTLLNINVKGLLVGVHYHDGLLTGIDLSEAGSALLTIAPLDGDAWRLRPPGLAALTSPSTSPFRTKK